MTREIILIDDQKAKWDGVSRFFRRAYPDDHVTWVKNFRQAQSILTQIPYDLLILDMTFEVHGSVAEDLRFNGLAGLHVLQFMWRSKLNIPTIICTSHENYSDPDFGVIRGIDALEAYVRDIFGGVVLGCVLMGPDEAQWQNKMKAMVDRAPN